MWISGSAEIYAVVSGVFDASNSPQLKIVDMPYLDNDGTTYHHPLLRASFEFAPGLAFDAQATWIRSDVYKETSAFVGLRVIGK